MEQKKGASAGNGGSFLFCPHSPLKSFTLPILYVKIKGGEEALSARRAYFPRAKGVSGPQSYFFIEVLYDQNLMRQHGGSFSRAV